jgi:outer membrane murein-binding lipoprotein Lpp
MHANIHTFLESRKDNVAFNVTELNPEVTCLSFNVTELTPEVKCLSFNVTELNPEVKCLSFNVTELTPEVRCSVLSALYIICYFSVFAALFLIFRGRVGNSVIIFNSHIWN